MKLCKDCSWCEFDGEDSKCLNPRLKMSSQSVITGEVKHGWMAANGTMQDFEPFCRTARMELTHTQCGPDPKLFEPSLEYAEYLRDKKIEANQERRQDRAEERENRRGFEENEGARE